MGSKPTLLHSLDPWQNLWLAAGLGHRQNPSPAGTLILCHKGTPLPTDLRGSPTGCIPPIRYKFPCIPWIRRWLLSLYIVSMLLIPLITWLSFSLCTTNLVPVHSCQHLCSLHAAWQSITGLLIDLLSGSYSLLVMNAAIELYIAGRGLLSDSLFSRRQKPTTSQNSHMHQLLL